MTTTENPSTSDGTALLAAIALHPDEDTPRLMYADYLQENGDGDRAEMIRVGCELANREGWPVDNRGEELIVRQAELLKLHEATWRRPPCPTCKGRGTMKIGGKAVCPRCLGAGSCGPLSGTHPPDVDSSVWEHEVTWTKGFPVVRCRLEEVGYEKRSWVDGTMMWLTPPWAIEVVRTGGTFEVTDWVVHPSGGSVTYYLGGLGQFPKGFWSGLENLPTRAAVHVAANSAVHRVVCRAAFTEEVKS